MVVSHRVPSSARPTTTAGTTSSLGAPGVNGRDPKATGPHRGSATSSSASMAASAAATERAAAAGSPPGEPGAAPLEQHAVAAGERQQVDVGVEPAGPGHEGRHDALVARMSWAIPPESRRRSTSAKPASATMRRSSSGAGR